MTKARTLTAREPWSLIEPPARRAIRLGGAQTDDRVESEPVKMPRRWPGARRAVGGGERVAGYLGRPADVTGDTGHPLQDCWLGDPGRPTVPSQVHAREPVPEPAGRGRPLVSG